MHPVWLAALAFVVAGAHTAPLCAAPPPTDAVQTINRDQIERSGAGFVQDVVRPRTNPIYPQGGIAVLRADKRQAEVAHLSLAGLDEIALPVDPDVLAVHEALERLQGFDERRARVLELRFFAGLELFPAFAELIPLGASGPEGANLVSLARESVLRLREMTTLWGMR